MTFSTPSGRRAYEPAAALATSAAVCLFVASAADFTLLPALGRALALAVYLAAVRGALQGHGLGYGLSLGIAVFSLLIVGPLGPLGFWAVTAVSVAVWLRALIATGAFAAPRWPIAATAVASALLAVACLSELPTSYGGFFIETRLLNAAPHSDTVQHIGMSNMVTDYGRVSTGLHGTTSQGYHALSHLVYGGAARALGMPVSEAYGFVTLIVFAPLLFWSLAAAAARLAPSARLWMFGAGALVTASGFLGHDGFVECSVWYSHLLSESQLMGLFLFLGFLTDLLDPEHPPHPLAAALLLPAIAAVKVPVGTLALAAYGAHLLARHGFSPRGIVTAAATGIPAAVTTLAAAKFFMPQGIPITWGFLAFERSYFPPACVAMETPLALRQAAFTGYHYFFVWLAFVLLAMHAMRGTFERGRLRALTLILTVVAIGGFVPLSMSLMAGGAFFFSNTATFTGMAILVGLLVRLVEDQRASTAGGRALPSRIVTAAILVWGIGGLALYYPGQVRRAWDAIAVEAATPFADGPFTPYARHLESISETAPRDYLVYVGKDQEGFWQLAPDCTRAGMLIPALAERPGLYALPSAECRDLIQRDYHAYLDKTDASGALRIPHEQLCAETRALGFRGYVDVRRDGAEAHACEAEGR